MRELKFRVYDSDADVWVKNVSDFTVSSLYERCPSYHKVIQYTGLKDKNGKDIFEGDIVEFGLDTRFIGEIIFAKGCFMIYERNTGTMSFVNSWITEGKETKIIGNIYENKELIKEIK